MTRRIYKYEIGANGAGEFGVEMHGDAVIRHFGTDPRGVLCVWAEVDPLAKTQVRRLYIYGTGHPIADGLFYFGTCKETDYMWHLYLDKAK